MNARIVKVTKEHNISDNTDFLDVTVELFSNDEDENRIIKRFGFPTTVTQKEIINDIKKTIQVTEQELENKIQDMEKQEENKNVEKIIDKLPGTVI